MNRTLEHVPAAAILGMVVLSIGCGADSPVLPTTPVTQVSVSSVSPDAGPIDGNLIIRITGIGFRAGAIVVLGGVAAQVTDVNPTAIVAIPQPHAAGTVDVVVANPNGHTARLERGFTFGVFSLTASAAIAAPGEPLTVNWVAPEGRGCTGGGDWIALYRVGAPDNTGASNGHSDLWYDHVCGATSGSRTLTAPDQPGDYEFRFMVGETSVARSGAITVRFP